MSRVGSDGSCHRSGFVSIDIVVNVGSWGIVGVGREFSFDIDSGIGSLGGIGIDVGSGVAIVECAEADSSVCVSCGCLFGGSRAASVSCGVEASSCAGACTSIGVGGASVDTCSCVGVGNCRGVGGVSIGACGCMGVVKYRGVGGGAVGASSYIVVGNTISVDGGSVGSCSCVIHQETISELRRTDRPNQENNSDSLSPNPSRQNTLDHCRTLRFVLAERNYTAMTLLCFLY